MDWKMNCILWICSLMCLNISIAVPDLYPHLMQGLSSLYSFVRINPRVRDFKSVNQYKVSKNFGINYDYTLPIVFIFSLWKRLILFRLTITFFYLPINLPEVTDCFHFLRTTFPQAGDRDKFFTRRNEDELMIGRKVAIGWREVCPVLSMCSAISKP